MKDKISVRLYRDGDGEAVNILFNQVFQKDRVLDHWRWKYLSSPVTPSSIISVAETGGKIVGAYPYMTTRFKIAGSEALVVQAADICILPEYRRGWTLMRLLSLCHQQIRKSSVAIGFGFPNESANEINARLPGLDELCRISILRKRLNITEVFRAKNMLREHSHIVSKFA